MEFYQEGPAKGYWLQQYIEGCSYSLGLREVRSFFKSGEEDELWDKALYNRS